MLCLLLLLYEDSNEEQDRLRYCALPVHHCGCGQYFVDAKRHIIDRGSHAQLLAQNGAYAELYNSQFA